MGVCRIAVFPNGCLNDSKLNVQVQRERSSLLATTAADTEVWLCTWTVKTLWMVARASMPEIALQTATQCSNWAEHKVRDLLLWEVYKGQDKYKYGGRPQSREFMRNTAWTWTERALVLAEVCAGKFLVLYYFINCLYIIRYKGSLFIRLQELLAL